MSKQNTTYRITDHLGRELGEAEGKDRPAAVVALMRMDPKGPKVSRTTAEGMIRDRMLRFERVA